VALASSPGCFQGLTGHTNNIEVRSLNFTLASVAQKYHCPFLDTYSILLGSDGKPLAFFYQPDGEHLSELGYARWGDSVLSPYIKANGLTCVGMVGDSITGRIGTVKLQNGTVDATWSDLLGIKAYNFGIDGQTSADVVQRLDSLVQPDIECYFLMIGNNDLHAGLPESQTADNVAIILQFLTVAQKKKVVVQAVMPFLGSSG
jgi:lysophospholipase L1-like esterase